MIIFKDNKYAFARGYKFDWSHGNSPTYNKYIKGDYYGAVKKTFAKEAIVVGPDWLTSWKQPKETS